MQTLGVADSITVSSGMLLLLLYLALVGKLYTRDTIMARSHYLVVPLAVYVIMLTSLLYMMVQMQ